METIKKALIYIYSMCPPYFRHLRGCYNSVHKFYQDAQWWSKEQIESWQLARLKELVKYAYNNTSGYHQLYSEAGLLPLDINQLDDIKKLPFTSKALIRDNIKDFTVPPKIAGRLHQDSTGGSSGSPLIFYTDVRNIDAEYAFIYTAWESIGWKETDIGVILRGRYLGDPEHLIKKVGYRLYALSSRFLTDENYDKYISHIKESKATWLHAYPSTLTDLASLMIEHKQDGILDIKHIFLGSENYYQWQKKIIKKAFPNTQIMSWYGHSERAIWAPFCEQEQKYHLCPFYGYAELLNGDQPVGEGEIGELVGTSFWMFGTPFIRYRTNDYAEKGLSKCPKCGREFQLVNNIDGRLSEIIVGKSGRRISLTVFAGSIMHGKFFENIKQFRFVQEQEGELKLLIVPGDSFSNDDMEKLKDSLDGFLGDDFTCAINVVAKLEASKNGKYSYLDQRMNVSRSDSLSY